MSGLIKLILAILTAMNPASSGSIDEVAPDRPVIVAPTAIPINVDMDTSPDGAVAEIVGSIQSLDDNTIVVNGFTVLLKPQTLIVGKIQLGAQIQAVVIKRGGDLQAQQVRVISPERPRSSSSASSVASSESSESSSESSRSSSRSSSIASSRSSSRSSSSAESSESSRSSSSASSKESSRSSSSAESSESSRSSSSASSKESSRSSSSESSDNSRSSSSSSSREGSRSSSSSSKDSD